MSFDSRILNGMLVCTKCRSGLVRDGNALVCTSPECRLKFAIADEIPNMLLEEASPLEGSQWNSAMQRAGRDAATGKPLTT